MSAKHAPALLTKRERQIMDVLYRLGRATAAEIVDGLLGAPGYSTVRTQLRVLERKGHVKHEEEGLRYVYMPTVPRHSARRSALKHLVDTFFEGSTAKAVTAVTLLSGLAIRSSVMLVVGLLLSACLAKRSAALRHRVLAAALLAAAVVMPFSLVLPGWN